MHKPPKYYIPSFLLALFAIVMLSGCSGGGGGGGASSPTLMKIDITPTSASVAKGESTNLTATGIFSNGSTSDLTTQVNWTSASPTIASIVSNVGLVTGVTVGTTNVIATMSGVSSPAVNISVTVSVVTGITITATSASISKGSTSTLTATATYSDNTTGNVSGSVNWLSSDTTVVTMNSSGIASTQAQGTSNITASLNNVTSNSFTLTVTPPLIVSLSVTPTTPSVAVGSTIQLTATASFTDGATSNVTNTAVWSSTSNSIATIVSSTGMATGVSVGTDTIFVALNNIVSSGVALNVHLATFSLASVTDPLAQQQWALLNTGQTAYADNSGVANTTGLLGSDINVNPVYTTYGYTGRGVIVGVVDTGLEIAHEDLASNVVSGGSWNFVTNNNNPTNTATTGDHGTMVSGLIAMAKNGIGGIGVAPDAKLEAFNYLAPTLTQTDAEYLVSIGGSTSNPNSNNVFIFNQSFGLTNTTDTPIPASDENQYAWGTTNLRGGKGAIYVKSAGNGFTSFGTATCTAANSAAISCQNANFDPVNTLPYNIVQAALNAKGEKTDYSTAGSAIWTSTPGGEYGGNAVPLGTVGFSSTGTNLDPAMITTDQSGCSSGDSVSTATHLVGPYSYFNLGGSNLSSINLNCNYTNGMNGTSSAAPMMTGIIALMLEANPALTWREVKDILAKTAVPVDVAYSGVTLTLSNGTYVAELPWITNAAGYKYHNWYGFGAANASAAVNLAINYVSGSLGTFANTGWISGTLPTLASATIVPDNSITGVNVPFTVPAVGAAGKVEAVQIKVATSSSSTPAPSGCTAAVGYTGDLSIELTSPSGTKSILKNTRDGFNGANLTGMVLASNAFYGETSTGAWTVKVVDGWACSGFQTLTSVQIRVYGH
jgi:subtilisin family serine protease/uncharacterized protein YjdB